MWNYRVIADNETGEGTTKEIKRAEGSKLTSPDFFLYEKWSPWKSSGRPLYVVIFNDRKSRLKFSILNTKLSTRFADMRPCGLAYARCGKRILVPFGLVLYRHQQVCPAPQGRGTDSAPEAQSASLRFFIEVLRSFRCAKNAHAGTASLKCL